jgi:hypothetical protein
LEEGARVYLQPGPSSEKLRAKKIQDAFVDDEGGEVGGGRCPVSLLEEINKI